MKATGLLEGQPLSLLGHSSGAYVGLEACLYLKTHWGYTPQRLIAVAVAPPHVSLMHGATLQWPPDA